MRDDRVLVSQLQRYSHETGPALAARWDKALKQLNALTNQTTFQYRAAMSGGHVSELAFLDEAVSSFGSLDEFAEALMRRLEEPELENVSGQYLEDCTIAKPWSDDHPMSGVKSYALDPANALVVNF